MNDIELATIVAGIVATVRQKYPKIDGAYVWALVPVMASIVCLVYLQGAWQDRLVRAAKIAIESIAGVSLGGYIASKAATKVQDDGSR
jgi:hypothetical protein